MKPTSLLLAVSAAVCFVLISSVHAQAGTETKYPERKPAITLETPQGWKSVETAGGKTLTLTPAAAGGVYKITLQSLPDGTVGDLSEVCAKCAETAMKEPGVQPTNVHHPETDKTSRGTQLAVSYCQYKEGGQDRYCFLCVVSPAAGKYYQVTIYFNAEKDEGEAQETLTAVLDSIKPL